MANQIIAKATSAVNATGPGGSAAAITASGYTTKTVELTLINDGADAINYFINVDTGALPAFADDSFTLNASNSITHIVHGFENFFMICDTGDTATVRYILELIPSTNRTSIVV